MLESGCFCIADHELAPTGDRCVPIGGAADGGVDVDAGSVDGGHDAGPLAPGTIREVPRSSADCAMACAELGFPCTTTCEEGAGWASYGYYDWDYGWYRSVHQESLATCVDGAPFSEWTEAGETYELGAMYCCCEIPEVTTRPGSAAAPRTCDDICADDGLACAGFHEWPSDEGVGGLIATYYRAATGSVTYIVMGCGAIPSATRRIANAERTLRDYRCACYEP
jgi:hypothetical protein